MEKEQWESMVGKVGNIRHPLLEAGLESGGKSSVISQGFTRLCNLLLR